MIKVYTTPDCVQCNQTKKFLDKYSVPYETIDLSTDAEAMAMVKELGYKSAPVVITPHGHWSGFKYDKLKDTVTNDKDKQ